MSKFYPKRTQSILRGENPVIQSGYSGNTEKISRKIGDTWTDSDGVVWEQKDGYVSKQRSVDPAIPLFCDKCKNIMNKSADAKMYAKNGMCLDCTVERDTEMIKNGTFEAYQKKRMSEHIVEVLQNGKKEIKAYLENLDNIEFIQIDENQEYKKEQWSIDDKKRVKQQFEAELVSIEKELKLLNGES